VSLLLLVVGAATAAATQSPVNYAADDPVPRHATFTIESKAVNEKRVINVYTPPGYGSSGGQKYPVLYMPDGGMKEDFPHVANTVDSLIAARAIPPMIVVGIENTERRRDVTGPTTVKSDSAIAPRVGGSAAFRAFIQDELIPDIERRYRTTPERTIVGESLAGLFVVETFLLEPRLFRSAIALSPSLWWNGGALLAQAAELIRASASVRHTLFLTAATEPGIAAETQRLAGILEANPSKDLIWHYEPRPDLEHGNIFRRAFPAALVKVLTGRH
jgi:predicted alpha/beta superfamily hydrolase